MLKGCLFGWPNLQIVQCLSSNSSVGLSCGQVKKLWDNKYGYITLIYLTCCIRELVAFVLWNMIAINLAWKIVTTRPCRIRDILSPKLVPSPKFVPNPKSTNSNLITQPRIIIQNSRDEYFWDESSYSQHIKVSHQKLMSYPFSIAGK